MVLQPCNKRGWMTVQISEELSGIQHVFFTRINKERHIVLPTSPTIKRFVTDIPISPGCTLQKGS